MGKNLPYLAERRGVFYFRLAVPLHLQAAIGRKELTYSLKSKELSVARTRCYQLLALCQQLFNQLEVGLINKKSEINVFVEDHIHAFLQTFGKRTIVVAEESEQEVRKFNTSEVFSLYIAECKGDREKTLHKKKSTFELWLSLLGDQDINKIGKPEARRFKSALMRLPKNLKQKYQDVNLRKIDFSIFENEPKLSNATINSRLEKLSAFLNWALDNGYYESPKNPFKRLHLSDTKEHLKRDSFTLEQLQTIFFSPIYTGSLSGKQNERYISGDMIVKDSLYWIPLIALYTGARLQEICQLETSDVYQKENIWLFDINDIGEHKRLKTEASNRLVPIHPALIKLGFLDHLQGMKEKGNERIFPDISLASDGTYSSNFSKTFSYFLKRFKIKTPKTSFHSFRHTFIDRMRDLGVDRELREALVGHLGHRTAHDNYGGPVGLLRLKEAICILDYDLSIQRYK